MKAPKISIIISLIFVFLAGSIVGRITVRREANEIRRPDKNQLQLLTNIPDVYQATDYSCGASALQAVLAYWGISESEDKLIKRLNSTPEKGTPPHEIVRVAREFGLQADLREGLSLDDMETDLQKGSTIIVDLQAWPEKKGQSWSETWDDGHCMILLGMDGENLYFEDPSLFGSRGFIPRQEFLDRWHDFEGAPPLTKKSRKYIHSAIFIQGKKASVPLPFERVK
jgi:uncharacterized protein